MSDNIDLLIGRLTERLGRLPTEEEAFNFISGTDIDRLLIWNRSKLEARQRMSLSDRDRVLLQTADADQIRKDVVYGKLTRGTFMEKACRLVYEYVRNQNVKEGSDPQFGVMIVWFSKTLQNWKALVITDLPDEMYYEVTYNGDKGETYIDAYKKVENVCIPDMDRPGPAPVPAVRVNHPPNIPASYR